MIKSNGKNTIKKVIISLFAILILYIAYESAYNCYPTEDILCRFESSIFFGSVLILSLPIFSLFYIVDGLIHKALLKKERRTKDVILIILFLSSTIYLISSTISRFNDDEFVAYKPVIYLYPEEKTEVNVKLDYDGNLKYTYPSYNNGWNVTAYPDGKIINDGKEYSYLFWEGKADYNWNIEEGFIVRGRDTVKFLQDKLRYMGLTPKEYNEFIVFWYPKMYNNKYNLIYFAKEEYMEKAKLNITPKPDSILRVFMVYKALDKPTKIKEESLVEFKRSGFTVIEWGGTEIK